VTGNYVFCAFLWVQTTTMMFELHEITWINLLLIWAAHLFSFLALLIVNVIVKFESYLGFGSISKAFGSGVSTWRFGDSVIVVSAVTVDTVVGGYGECGERGNCGTCGECGNCGTCGDWVYAEKSEPSPFRSKSGIMWTRNKWKQRAEIVCRTNSYLQHRPLYRR
jgi:ferredoxin